MSAAPSADGAATNTAHPGRGYPKWCPKSGFSSPSIHDSLAVFAESPNTSHHGVFTAVFMPVILGSTDDRAPKEFVGMAIGVTRPLIHVGLAHA